MLIIVFQNARRKGMNWLAGSERRREDRELHRDWEGSGEGVCQRPVTRVRLGGNWYQNSRD